MVTRRQQAQPRAAARDRYLRFGLVGVPDRYTEPITSQLEGRRFQDLPGADAALVLEGPTFLQWPRSGVVGLIGWPLAILANNLPPTANTIGLAIIFSIMFVLPPYMLTVAVVHQILRRRARRSDAPISGYPWLLVTLRVAPYAAMFVAIAAGIAGA
jgi:hypothetical protein